MFFEKDIFYIEYLDVVENIFKEVFMGLLYFWMYLLFNYLYWFWSGVVVYLCKNLIGCIVYVEEIDCFMNRMYEEDDFKII